MATNSSAGARIVKELLNNENYLEWSVCMKNYLLAQDLWDVVEQDFTDPTVTWKRKNAAAYHAILISCATEAAGLILDCSLSEDSARDAWDTLASAYNSGDEIVVEHLNSKNYKKWRLCMKSYLLAQDLWDVVKASQSEINDRAKRNAAAFDAILDSCGKEAVDLILDCSSAEDSARDAWKTLAAAYNSGDEVVKVLLHKKNYKKWRVCMKSYLLTEDLWDVVKPFQSESDASSKINVWKEKNAKAFDAILVSCGREAKNLILDCSSVEDSARYAWNALARAYNSDGYDPQYQALYNAIRIGNWDTTKEFLNDHPEALTAKISSEGKTPLHDAVGFKHLHIVEGLIELMSEKDLELQDEYGWTPLIKACAVGITEMAKCMVNKNKNLLTIPNRYHMIPVTKAVIWEYKEMARYLYSVTPLEVLLAENGHHGALLLIQCLTVKSLDIALDLLRRRPQLAITPTHDGYTFVQELAVTPSVFPSGCQLRFFQKWIYNWINIEPTVLVNEVCVDVQYYSNTRANEGKIRQIRGLMDRPISTFLDLLGIKKIYEMKLMHKQSQVLLNVICDQISTLNTKELQKCGLFNSIIQAARYGIHEFIATLINANLELAGSRNIVCRNFFYSAIQHRQAKVFSMIHGYIWKDQAANNYNNDQFTMLHMVGMLAPQAQLNRNSGAALQMQRELQWFKEVESIMSHGKKRMENKNGMTAKDLFTNEHKYLVKEGEKWMKETASSCTIVGALIVTIMFAVTFTVPGGNSQDTGYPIFKDKNSFMVFIISDAISLFSSSTSILMFLGILTSRYAEDDFLKSLPTKLIIGLSLLFISIATMMIAFCAALFIVLEGKLWIITPIILLAGFPIGVFVELQFPLLIEIFISTFGPGIFDRNVKNWP